MTEAKLFLAVLTRGYKYSIEGCDKVKVSKFPFPVPELKEVQFVRATYR